MIREEYPRRLVDQAYVDLYLSATDGARIYWPWRMQPVHEANRRFRDSCESYIIDSSFKDESITNADVLDCAHALEAEMAVLADVIHDKEATVDAVLEGLELYDDHAYDGDIMVPLQAPHDECYRDLAGQADAYAIGGVKDASDGEKVAAARSVRDLAGPEVQLHGLGFGVTDTLIEAVRERPGLLDSLDYSTPVQRAMNEPMLAGEERMSVVAAQAAATLVEDLRAVSPYPSEQSAEDRREVGQTGLDELTQNA